MNKPFHKCRLCLKLGEFCSIFERDDSMKLSEMVMSFADVQIYEGDGLSDRVCSSCIENLSSAYLFKIQVEKVSCFLKEDFVQGIQKAPTFDYNMLIDKDIRVHTGYGSIIEENEEQNSLKDGNILTKLTETQSSSDETDTDAASVKCSYCDQPYSSLGVHRCNVTCIIEKHSTGSQETLVAEGFSENMGQNYFKAKNDKIDTFQVSCVLCDDTYDKYNEYVSHVNRCTANVKLHYLVCPLCHDIHTEKNSYFKHLNDFHFKQRLCTDRTEIDNLNGDIDNIDGHVLLSDDRTHKNVRRKIGWSVENIYQEVVFKNTPEKKVLHTPTSSPLKAIFARLSNESFSTPKKINFRKLIEGGKAKTSNYIPFRRYLENYKQRKRAAEIHRLTKTNLKGAISDSDYGSPSGTSEESWKLKQNLICACDKKIFMLSEKLQDCTRISEMITSLGGIVAESTKMEMSATHFISSLPADACSGMMVCALATGKWLLHSNFVYDSFRNGTFLNEKLYEWIKHPKILELDNTSVEVAKAAVYWHLELTALCAKFPFEGMKIVLVMKKKYRQYYQMIFKTLKAKPMTYDPRTPGSCCSADYCFVDMRVIERVKLKFFASHNIPVFPYQYILIYLLNRGNVEDERKYLLQDYDKVQSQDTVDFLNKTC